MYINFPIIIFSLEDFDQNASKDVADREEPTVISEALSEEDIYYSVELSSEEDSTAGEAEETGL